jgi:hypothetical protein
MHYTPNCEVRASGARDLMDVLETVPGFDFGMDVDKYIKENPESH